LSDSITQTAPLTSRFILAHQRMPFGDTVAGLDFNFVVGPGYSSSDSLY